MSVRDWIDACKHVVRLMHCACLTVPACIKSNRKIMTGWRICVTETVGSWGQA